jgi:hypothetical protein
MFRHAAVLLPLLGISLRLRGFSKTKEWVESRLGANAGARTESSGAEASLERTCRMVNAAARYGISRPTCLEESLALWYLLRDQGVAASLRIGVRKQTEKFEAHAWVEHNGKALNQVEEAHRHYAAFEGEFSTLPEEGP